MEMGVLAKKGGMCAFSTAIVSGVPMVSSGGGVARPGMPSAARPAGPAHSPTRARANEGGAGAPAPAPPKRCASDAEPAHSGGTSRKA